MPLTVRDHMTLRLAAAHYRYPGARETDAFELLGLSPTLFHRHVSRLLDDPEALAAMPMEVRRLRRVRDARRRVRGRRSGVA